MFYKEIVQAKNQQKIPLFCSEKAAHSRYNPEREAENFGEEVFLKKNLVNVEQKSCEKNFSKKIALILGIAGGYHIRAFMKKNPSCKILAIERSQKDFEFLKSGIPLVNELSQNKNFLFVQAENLENAILQNYFPAIHGDIKILPLKSWACEDKIFFKKISFVIQSALKKVAADFSVQAHFASLWQKNIFFNLKTLSKIEKDFKFQTRLNSICIDTKKTAAIIAAGPSLDKTLFFVERERKNFFVIATDTGNKILLRRGLVPDAVISIDAQNASANHFIGKKNEKTIFALDLSSPTFLAENFFKIKMPFVFVNTGHPLSSFASCFCQNDFFRAESGSGTVTIAAADFAKKCGFEKIMVFGADFCYFRGKPYAKGSYLDDLYRKNECRTNNAETKFCALMFRTPLEFFLEDNEKKKSCEILFSYKKTFLQWLKKNAKSFEYKNSIWSAQLFQNTEKKFEKNFFFPSFDIQSFKNEIQYGIKNEIENLSSKNFAQNFNSPFFKIALPYLAFLRKRNLKTFCFEKEILLAFNKLLWYNSQI